MFTTLAAMPPSALLAPGRRGPGRTEENLRRERVLGSVPEAGALNRDERVAGDRPLVASRQPADCRRRWAVGEGRHEVRIVVERRLARTARSRDRHEVGVADCDGGGRDLDAGGSGTARRCVGNRPRDGGVVGVGRGELLGLLGEVHRLAGREACPVDLHGGAPARGAGRRTERSDGGHYRVPLPTDLRHAHAAGAVLRTTRAGCPAVKSVSTALRSETAPRRPRDSRRRRRLPGAEAGPHSPSVSHCLGPQCCRPST